MAGFLSVKLIAEIAHEANRAYCLSLGDFSQAPWRYTPGWQQDSAIDGVNAIIEGWVNSPEDSHVAWSKQKLEEGWKYGEVKDPEIKEHPCLVPFDALPKSQQMKDHIFFNVVKGLLQASAS